MSSELLFFELCSDLLLISDFELLYSSELILEESFSSEFSSESSSFSEDFSVFSSLSTLYWFP